MNPWKVSAQFAAFSWFEQKHPNKGTEEALRFARTHWNDFLPLAHKGLGKLLIRIGKRRRRASFIERWLIKHPAAHGVHS